MGERLIKKFRLITVDDFNQEEKFFRNMSEKGLHFVKYKFPFYYFERDHNKIYEYQTDFQYFEGGRDKDSYLQLFQDAGWELIFEYPGIYGTWFYFRKAAEKPVTKIFTDSASTIELYRKIRRNWLIFLLMLSPAALLLFLPLNSSDVGPWKWISISLWGIVALLYAKVAINLTIKIHKLTSSDK